jgi:hypothetical protein
LRWLKLAQRAGPAVKEAERLTATIQQRCEVLTPAEANEVARRIASWSPREIWLELKQREFQELLRQAADEDALRIRQR